MLNSSSFTLAIAYNQYAKSHGSNTQGAKTSAETHAVRGPPLISHLCAFSQRFGLGDHMQSSC